MPMKVIVCFDSVRVTVPCGEGNFPVKELINKAIHRYKRAVNKGTNHWVEVTNLKTLSGGGILDPDDELCDVVDDREQLVAEFEEHEGISAQHVGGDGASASSTGTVSPDFFTPDAVHEKTANGISSIFSTPDHNKSASNNASMDIVVTSSDLPLGSKLTVRRGSAPDLNAIYAYQLSPTITTNSSLPRRESVQDSDEPCSESSDDEKRSMLVSHRSLDRKKTTQKHLTRDALRASLSNHLERHRWLEEQKKSQQVTKQSQFHERISLLEGHDGHEKKTPNYSNRGTVCLYNDGGPLGIHAVPALDGNGKNIGLLIHSIEPDRPVHKDGTIKAGDIVIEINGISLEDVSFNEAQEIFRAAKDTKEIYLKLAAQKVDGLPTLSSGKHITGSQPPPVMPKPRSHMPLRPSPLTLTSNNEQTGDSYSPSSRDLSQVASHASIVRKQGSDRSLSSSSSDLAKNATKSSNNQRESKKKIPPKVPARNANTLLTGLMGDVPLNAITNTKKIGKKIVINLVKSPLGLGFSVTSRDNQTDGNTPIYIRNILPQGAAVSDGQLRPGDRLLQVNGVEMTGKTQTDAVKFLRMIPEGSQVELVISRQEEVDEKFRVPRKMDDNVLGSKNGNSYVDGDKCVDEGEPDILPLQLCPSDEDSFKGSKEKITLHIPLNETGSAGLGVSVKGKTETIDSNSRDLGIFVKTVLQGGAAYKDGRLLVNDQLLEVNGVKLEGLSNSTAMEALRLAMIQDGSISGAISLTVARQTSQPQTQDVSPGSNTSDGSGQFKSQSDSEVVTFSHTMDKGDSNPQHKDKAIRNPGSNFNSEILIKGFPAHYSKDDKPLTTRPTIISASKDSKGAVSESKLLTFQSQRPHSTIGFIHDSEKLHCGEDIDALQLNLSPDDADLNSKSLFPFEREGLGRQSMSEKRKGHLDPRSTEIYKIVKANKDSKGMTNIETNQPFLKTNIFSDNLPVQQTNSNTVLQTNAVSVFQTNSGDSYSQREMLSQTQENLFSNKDDSTWINQHFGRGRACNDSFRAAVDRSYDVQDPVLMDTLEEESVESGALDPSLSGRSSISSDMNEDNNSLQRFKLKEKKGNILKGFLRFGKGKKSQDEVTQRSRSEERSTSRTNPIDIPKHLHREDKVVHKPMQTIDFIPISEPSVSQGYRNRSDDFLVNKEQMRSHSVEPTNRSHFLTSPLSSSLPKHQQSDFMSSSYEQRSDPRYFHPAAITHRPKMTDNIYEDDGSHFRENGNSSYDSKAFKTRAEYVQQLRTIFQQHHRQRHGVYPREDQEELYEKQLQESEYNISYNEHDFHNQKGFHLNERVNNRKIEHPSSQSNDKYNYSNTSFFYAEHIPGSSNNSSNYTYHDHHTANREATRSYTPSASNYSLSTQPSDMAYHGQSFKPTYYGPASQYMFPKSNSPHNDMSSARV